MPELSLPFWLRRRVSVGVKCALTTTFLTAIVAAISFNVILQRLRGEAAAQSKAAARGAETRIVGAVQGVFNGALDIIKITSDELAAQRDKGVTDPVVYDTILRHMIEAGTDHYAAWYVWGEGSWPARKGPVTTPPVGGNGRFATYWHQNGMEMLQDRVPGEILESFLYKVPAESGQSVLLEPHAIDAANGDPTLVTSLSRPAWRCRQRVRRDCSRPEARCHQRRSAIELPAGAKLTIVSDGGVIAMSTSKGWAGSALRTISPLLVKRFEAARKGDGSEFIGGDVPTLRAWNAIRFDGINEPWYLFLDLPEESFLATVSNDKILLILVPAVALLALLGLVLLAMDRLVTRPLKVLSTIIVGLGEGLFNFSI